MTDRQLYRMANRLFGAAWTVRDNSLAHELGVLASDFLNASNGHPTWLAS